MSVYELLATFLITMTTSLRRSNLKEEGFIYLTLTLGHSASGHEGMVELTVLMAGPYLRGLEGRVFYFLCILLDTHKLLAVV